MSSGQILTWYKLKLYFSLSEPLDNGKTAAINLFNQYFGGVVFQEIEAQGHAVFYYSRRVKLTIRLSIIVRGCSK